MKKILSMLLLCLLLICFPTSCSTPTKPQENDTDSTACTEPESIHSVTQPNGAVVEYEDLSDIILATSLEAFSEQIASYTPSSVATSLLLQSAYDENLSLDGYEFKSITYSKSKNEAGIYTGCESMTYYWHPQKCPKCAEGLSCHRETVLTIIYSASDEINQDSINRGYTSTSTDGLYIKKSADDWRSYIFWINPQTFCRFHIDWDNPSTDEITSHLIAFCKDMQSSWNEHEMQ